MPTGAEADVKEGDALALPFADGEFDRVVAAEVLEHIPADIQAIDELVRVLRPGGTMAVTVPRWFPEVVCWKLSDDYHNNPGGHIRIYTDKELVAKARATPAWSSRARTTPTACTRRTGGSSARSGCATTTTRSPKAYHRLLVWDIMKQPPDAAAGRAGARPAHRQEHGALLPQARCRLTTPPWVPSVAGVLDAAEVAETAASIAPMQEPDGAIPWTVGEHTDVWNHVEAAMALLVGGRGRGRRARLRVGAGAPSARDGSWPMKVVGGEVEDASGETNMSAYLAVGRVAPLAGPPRRRRSSHRMWPPCAAPSTGWSRCSCPSAASPGRRSGHDGPAGRVNREALLAGSSSIYQRCAPGCALAELLDEPQPEWELAGGRLGHALREHRDLFLDKSTFSMDWYYPVLGGAVRGDAGARAARRPLGRRSSCPASGIRCVDTEPVGDRRRDLRAGARARRRRRPRPGACGCSPTCSTCATRTAATGPATSTPTTSTGRRSTRPTPRPR